MSGVFVDRWGRDAVDRKKYKTALGGSTTILHKISSIQFNSKPRSQVGSLIIVSATTMSLTWNPLNFYVFITYDNIIENSLRIPIEFTQENQKQILLNNKDVTLTVSDGKRWGMGWMTSSNGHLWLQNGWPQFVQHYRIKIGHLLLFNHQESSNFHVRIFNHTCCEINYVPLAKAPESEEEIDQCVLHETEVKTDLALEKGNKQRSRNRPLTVLASKKRNKQMSRNRALNVSASEKGNKRRSIKRETRSTISFKSDKPFCSGMVGGSSARRSGIGMYLPMQFCRRYLTSEKKCVDCVLQMPNGGIWGPVQCNYYDKSSTLSGKNWRKFCDDNHLVEGDLCVFELVNEIEKVLNVIIFRANTYK